ncbi:hypothetical protein OTB20_08285 [Streptomyces sp. H27-H1]|uniref:hypothetical protein n=1 Tax=Streptomyces sp. H27-H1 TaxID=2996461 RepID=UPI0022717391|nr:hypothetical protein [Streptomyces sp. H27-H1]MCY0926202.1 hypothetical protein [Streptomyces sp. H27-H1]
MTTTYELRPEDFGATPGADATEPFRRLFAEVDRRLKPDAGGSVPVSTVTVLLTGVYRVSGTIMRDAPGRAQGLTVRGIGKRSSEIVMTGAEPLLVNDDRWMGVRWYDVSFRSTNPAASFLYSSSTGGAQDWAFTNCEWRGAWRYGIGLDGPIASNCNSEWTFTGCHVNGSYDVAFLWSGMTPANAAQDQFLNFSFRDSKIEYDSGDFLRFDKGGFITVDGGSFIIKGKRPDGGVSRFFHLPTAGHYDSVQHLNVRGVRFELRNAVSQVIKSLWGGHIVFDGCSDTALGFQPHSPGLVAHEYTNPVGVSYRSCDLVGKHAYHLTAPNARQRVVYDGCTRKNNRTREAFLAVDGTKSLTAPAIVHVNDGDGIK